MVAQPPATLKTNMPLNTVQGIVGQDIHDIVDTFAGRLWVSVKDYGAVGDSTTNDTAAFVAAFAAGAGGTIFVPPGIYQVNPNALFLPSKTILRGSGLGTQLWKNNNGPLLSINGAANNNRLVFSSVYNIHLMGTRLTGALIDSIYADNLVIENVWFDANEDLGIKFTEVWDSRIDKCYFIECGTATIPSVNFLNGVNTPAIDNTNQIFITNSRFEQFKLGAIHMGQPGDPNVTNGIYISNCKFETNHFGGPIIKLNGITNGLFMDNIYFALNFYLTGFTAGPQTNLIDLQLLHACGILNVHAYTGVQCRSVIRCPASVSAGVSFQNIFHNGSFNPAVGIVDVAPSVFNTIFRGHVASNSGATAYSQTA